MIAHSLATQPAFLRSPNTPAYRGTAYSGWGPLTSIITRDSFTDMDTVFLIWALPQVRLPQVS